MEFSQKQITLPDYSKVRVFNKKNEEAIIVETTFINNKGKIKIFSNGRNYEFEIPSTHIETTISCNDEIFEFRHNDLFELFPILYKELKSGTKINLMTNGESTLIENVDHIMVRNGKVIVFYKTKNGIFKDEDFIE